METAPTNIDYLSRIKSMSAQYLPKEPQTLDGQRRLLQMIMAIVPPVQVCVAKAEREYWPQVEKKEMDLEKAIRLCALDVNNVLRITVVGNLKLETCTEEALLTAWAALDQFTGRQDEKSCPEMRAFQMYLATLLREKIQTREKVEELAAYITSLDETVEEVAKTVAVNNEDGKTAEAPASEYSSYSEVSEYTDTKGGKPKWLMFLIPAAVILLALVVMPLLNKVGTVERAIDKIGEVTLDSGAAIEKAEERYEALDEGKKGEVENYPTLVAAREAYDCLRTEDAISAIGTVTMESKEAIDAAKTLFDGLNDSQKAQVDNANVLTAADKEYTRLSGAVERAAQAIDAIGKVGLDSGTKVEAARKAYDALKADGLESYVADKESILTTAEKTYAKMASEDLYAKGMELYESGKYEAALENFDQIDKKFSDTPAAANAKKATAECRMKVADLACNRGDLYTAYTVLTALEKDHGKETEFQELYTKVTDRLVRARPGNGKSFYNNIGWGQCKLKVYAKEDMCVRVVDKKDSAKSLLFFVRAGEVYELGIKNGQYSVYYSTGTYWFNKDVGFGEDASYWRASNSLSLTTTTVGSILYYYRYELNLQTPSANDFKPVTCEAEAFWG